MIPAGTYTNGQLIATEITSDTPNVSPSTGPKTITTRSWPRELAIAAMNPTTSCAPSTVQKRRRAIAIDSRRRRGRPSTRPPMTAVASARASTPAAT